MNIGYEARYFIYDFIGMLCFIIVGYTVALELFVFTFMFFIVGYYVRIRLYRTIERQYNPEII